MFESPIKVQCANEKQQPLPGLIQFIIIIYSVFLIIQIIKPCIGSGKQAMNRGTQGEKIGKGKKNAAVLYYIMFMVLIEWWKLGSE